MTPGLATCLVIGVLPSSLVNFRGPLLKAMRAKGHVVFAAANGRDPDTEAKLKDMGVAYFPIRIARAGMNPLVDFMAFFDLHRLIRRVRPNIVLAYTIKPVIYGGLAAWMCGVCDVYSLVTGLGYAFMDPATRRQRWVGRVARILYRASLRHSRRVFFQNPDDARAFVEMKLVDDSQAVLVNGSGVDLDLFSEAKISRNPVGQGHLPLRFLLVARLLKDKGIVEYVEAARAIRQEYPQTEFHLIGPFDSNPAALTPSLVESWKHEGRIQFHGEQADVRPGLRQCDVYVLPSYREGTPRTVLEAMAMGRAIITTDAPGCRETVLTKKEGERTKPRMDASGRESGKLKVGSNGILIPVRDAEALADAMEFFIQHPDEIIRMGAESRRYAEERYDVHKVNSAMLEAMEL